MTRPALTGPALTGPASTKPPRTAAGAAPATHKLSGPAKDPKLSGRAVLFMIIAGFSVIIGANLVLAVSAVRSFPGLETDNSYIASQTFDRDRAAQQALGWDVAASIDGDLLRLSFDGTLGPARGPSGGQSLAPPPTPLATSPPSIPADAAGAAAPATPAPKRAGVADVSGTLGRATHTAEDRIIRFHRDGTIWVARIPASDDQGPLLGVGNWNLRLTARADDGTLFRQRIPLLVKAVR